MSMSNGIGVRLGLVAFCLRLIFLFVVCIFSLPTLITLSYSFLFIANSILVLPLSVRGYVLFVTSVVIHQGG